MDNISEDQQNVINMILHPDILEKIIEFIPPQKRGNVALTSKIFYETVCHLEEYSYPLELNFKPEEDIDPGILLSKRKFNQAIVDIRIKMTNMEFNALKEIFEIHGKTIIYLDIASALKGLPIKVELEASTWISLIEQLPNLEDLEISGLDWVIKNWDSALAIPVLEKMKTFTHKIVNSNLGYAFLKMFPRDKINKLEVHHPWDRLCHFLGRQSQIKNLLLAFDCFINRTFFGCVQLETLKILQMENWRGSSLVAYFRENIYNVIARQSALTELSFPHNDDSPISLDARAMETLTFLHDLKCLTTGPLFQMDMGSIHEIAKFKHLKKLHIDIRNLISENLIQLTSIRLPGLKKVSFFDIGHIIPNSRDSAFDNPRICDNIKNNWPNLTHLNVNSGINFLNAFLDIQQLESLTIRSQQVTDDPDEKEPLYFISNNQQYPNMKKLAVGNVKITYIQELFTALPNLEKILLVHNYCHAFSDYSECMLDYSPHLMQCLKKMKNLVVLSIALTIKSEFIHLTIEDAKLFMDLCSKLSGFFIVLVLNEESDNSEFINHLELSDDCINVSISQSGDEQLITLKDVVW